MYRTTQTLLSTVDVGSMNRARVMRFLYNNGALTRSELAARLGVSRATIGAVIQSLLDAGVLVEQEPLAVGSMGGKPARPLWFSSHRALGAVYLSSQECVVASVGMDGVVGARHVFPITHDDRPRLTDELVDVCRDVFDGCQLAGVGVALAGMVDTTTGELIANYLRPGIGSWSIGESLRESLRVPVFADHHPRVQAFGDAWFGLARELDSFASVYTGEVLGVGMFQNGQILRGPRGAGGEAGHIVVDFDGDQCLCGRRGCWETVATLGWLRRAARDRGLADIGTVSSARLIRESEEGDERARDLLDDYVDHLSVGLVNLEQVLGLNTYIIHGEVNEGGETMRTMIEQRLIAHSPRREPAPRVLFAANPDDSTLLGAAGMVLSNVYRARL